MVISIKTDKKTVRDFKSRMNQDVNSFLYKFKRQYRAFPLKNVTKLTRTKFKPDDTVKINGYTYHVKDALRRLKSIYRKLKTKTNRASYTKFISAFEKECNGKTTNADIRRTYDAVNKELQAEFKSARDDLWTCLNILKSLNALSKEQSKVPKLPARRPVLESVIFDEKTFEQDVDKFGKSSNIIFIAGLSGSGKSTKASELAKKYNAVNIELDLFDQNQILFDDSTNHDEGNLIMRDYFTTKYKSPKKFKSDSELKEFGKLIEGFLKYIVKYASEHKDKNFVIEGIQLQEFNDNKSIIDILKKYPCIIMGTSIIHSMINAAHRENMKLPKYMLQSSVKSNWEWIGWYLSDDKTKRELKKILQEAVLPYGKETFNMDEKFITECATLIVENAHKNNIGVLQFMEECLSSIKDKVPAAEQAYQENAVMEAKEEVRKKVDAKRVDIYSAYQEGKITLEEREEMLDKLREALVLEEVGAINAINETGEETPKQKYDALKLALYEKCEAGEITVEEREAMIAEAYNNIMVTESDDVNGVANDVNKSSDNAIKSMEDAAKKLTASKDIDKDIDKNFDAAAKTNAGMPN